MIAMFLTNINNKFILIVIYTLSILNGVELTYAASLGMMVAIVYVVVSNITNSAHFLTESDIALEKIEEFLRADNIDTSYVNQKTLPQDIAIDSRNGNYYWQDRDPEALISQQNLTLSGIDLTIKKGELVGIVGKFGSGKSSLVNSLLGEMNFEGLPSLNTNGRIAYASQKPWIMSDTVRNNILFGEEFNIDRYN